MLGRVKRPPGPSRALAWCAALPLLAACDEPSRALVRDGAAADAPPDERTGPPDVGDCAARNGGCSTYARCEPAGAGRRRCVCVAGLRVKADGRSCEGLLLVSVTPGGRAGDGTSASAAVAATGRYVAFHSTAVDLPTDGPVARVTPPVSHGYLRDVVAGRTAWITARSDGGVAAGGCGYPNVTDDGRRVAFACGGSFVLDDPPPNGAPQGYVREVSAALVPGPPRRLHLEASHPHEGGVLVVQMSRDGRRFAAWTTSRLTGEGPAQLDGFLYTEDPPTVTAITVDSQQRFPPQFGGCDGNNDVHEFSGDGNFIGFHGPRRYSDDDDDFGRDSYIRDLRANVTELLPGRRTAAPPSAGCSNRGAGGVALSYDGRYALFFSDNRRLDETLTRGDWDFFLRDRAFPVRDPRGVRRLYVRPVVNPANPDIRDEAGLSDDARYAAVVSYRRLDLPGAAGATAAHLYLLDLSDPSAPRPDAELVDVDARGELSASEGTVFEPDLAGDGSAVAFTAGSPLVPEDTNTHPDVYLRVFR